MMMISLAFLAPDLVRTAINGRLPRGVGVTRLIDAPIEWSQQWHMLGPDIELTRLGCAYQEQAQAYLAR